MNAQRLFVIIGLCAVVLFTFITPPFQVPDEVGHFWRALSISRGDVFPRVERAGAVAKVPQGYATIVFVFWKPTAGAQDVKITWPQFQTSPFVRIEDEKRATITFPAGYTPVPYTPQIVAALITRVIQARPVITFYLGRLFNAIAYIALIAFAIGTTPILKWLFAAAGLLPMALYLAASWSPDAMTIAGAFFFTAALLRGARTPRHVALLAAAGAFVGLCKPAYFLIALLALAIPGLRGKARAVMIAATACGVALAMWNAARMFAPVRSDAHVDPAAQLACLADDPAHFARAALSEIQARGADYVRQMIGRLGLLDIWLPEWIIRAELLVLVVCAYAAEGGGASLKLRVVAFIVSMLTVAGIALSSYIGWTPPCAPVIDGLQGRYLLPIVPVFFLVIGAPLIKREQMARVALAGVAVAANATALFAVASRYYW